MKYYGNSNIDGAISSPEIIVGYTLTGNTPNITGGSYALPYPIGELGQSLVITEENGNKILKFDGITSSGSGSEYVTATGSTTPRTLANRFANEYNVLDYGAKGDGVTHPISALQASNFNDYYAGYGTLNALPGDEHDWCVLQGLLLKATTTGIPVYIPTGIYFTNRPLTITYYNNPIFFAGGETKLDIIRGDGLQTQISALISLTGRGILELLGSSNGSSVSAHVENIRLYARPGSHLGSCCLRVGDSSCGFDAHRVFCHGVSGYLLKVASSSSYAQINTKLSQCHFWGNFQREHWPDESTCTAYSIKDESGGAFWDNVEFDTCLFAGVAITRAGNVLFQNCQYITNAIRPDSGGYSYSSNLMAYAGNLECHECYFEDHKYGILLIDGSAPIRGALITGCHFSGANNASGAPMPTAAIICANTSTYGFGQITLIRNDINSAGYTQPSIQAVGCKVFEIGSFNLGSPAADITFDYSYADYTRINVNGQFQSSKIHSIGTAVDSISSDGGISAVSTISSEEAVNAPFITAIPSGSGATSGGLWGLGVQNANSSNTALLGWSSTAYTSGGTIPWLDNNEFFLAIPFGSKFKMGFGNSTSTVKFDLGSIVADDAIISNTSVSSPFITAARIGDGNTNASLWGVGVQTADGLNSALLGWSSTAYTSGGGVNWLGNDQMFLALPVGDTLKVGFGTNALDYLEFGLNILYAPQANASFLNTVTQTLTTVKNGTDYLTVANLINNVAGDQAFNWQLSASGHADLYTYNGTTWQNSIRVQKTGEVILYSSTDATSLTAGASVINGGQVVTKNQIVGQGQGWGVTSVVTSGGVTTLNNESKSILILTGSTTHSVQLPLANIFGAGIAVVYIIKNRSSGTVTINRAGSDTIDGDTSITLIGGTKAAVILASDGNTAWEII